ncbi:MAG: hypothetical protein E7521_09355 [Ruminococcaceae bacterium]|nr:hypothetical protein [Oscillospiraceae bacterium]MBE6811231.1 hypothetical protein [Oscillospiraceae bacterium]
MKNYRINVTITDDLGIGSGCDIIINGKQCFLDEEEKSKTFEIENSSGICEISITKKNVWKDHSKALIFVLSFSDMVIGLLDGFGPNEAFSCDNMPFEIDFSHNTIEEGDASFKYKLSDMIKTDEDNLAPWSRLVSFEAGILAVLVVAIFAILGFVFKGFIGVILWLCALPTAGILSYFAKRKALSRMEKIRSKDIYLI